MEDPVSLVSEIKRRGALTVASSRLQPQSSAAPRVPSFHPLSRRSLSVPLSRLAFHLSSLASSPRDLLRDLLRRRGPPARLSPTSRARSPPLRSSWLALRAGELSSCLRVLERFAPTSFQSCARASLAGALTAWGDPPALSWLASTFSTSSLASRRLSPPPLPLSRSSHSVAPSRSALTLRRTAVVCAIKCPDALGPRKSGMAVRGMLWPAVAQEESVCVGRERDRSEALPGRTEFPASPRRPPRRACRARCLTPGPSASSHGHSGARSRAARPSWRACSASTQRGATRTTARANPRDGVQASPARTSGASRALDCASATRGGAARAGKDRRAGCRCGGGRRAHVPSRRSWCGAT